MTTDVCRRGCASKTFRGMTCTVGIGLAGFGIAASQASDLTGVGGALQHQFKQDRFARHAVASSMPRAGPFGQHPATFKDLPQCQAAAAVHVGTMVKP